MTTSERHTRTTVKHRIANIWGHTNSTVKHSEQVVSGPVTDPCGTPEEMYLLYDHKFVST